MMDAVITVDGAYVAYDTETDVEIVSDVNGVDAAWKELLIVSPTGASIRPWDLPFLPRIPYDYRSFRGRASDVFPDEFVMIDDEADFKSMIVEVNIHQDDAVIVFTLDGVSEQSIMIASGHKVSIISTRGFKIRTKVPGDDCYYQLIFFR